jgi:uncharacterized protein YfdQ (DUF2303 family)
MTPIRDEIAEIRKVLLAGVFAQEGAVLVPDGYRLIPTESFQTNPERIRGQYHTSILKEFAAYLGTVGDNFTTVFVDPDAMQAVARIDHGTQQTPGWGDHVAMLKLEPTPEYQGLLNTMRGTEPLAMPQDALVDWVTDWAPALAFYTGDLVRDRDSWQSYSLSATLQALRKLQVRAAKTLETGVTDISRSRSALEKAEVTSDPPSVLCLSAQPYPELGPRDFFARLVYLPSDPITIKLRWAEMAVHRRSMAEEFAEQVRLAVTDENQAIDVRIGRFAPGPR